MLIYLRDRSPLTILHAATLRIWDRSCGSNFPSHPVTVYWHRADQSQHWPYNARVATWVPVLKSLVWLDPEKSWRKRESNPRSSALKANALTTRPMGQLAVEEAFADSCSSQGIANMGGQNSSLVVFGLAVHSVAGSILLWGNFLVEGIFPLELTGVQTPFPPKLFRMRV